MTDYQMSKMINFSPNKSPSINLKSKKKTTFMDDYGVKLPDADIKRNRVGDSEATSQCSSDAEDFSSPINTAEDKIQRLKIVGNLFSAEGKKEKKDKKEKLTDKSTIEPPPAISKPRKT